MGISLFVFYAVRVAVVASDPARCECPFHVIVGEAKDDQGGRRWGGVAAQPRGIRTADRNREMVGGAENFDGALFAVVADHNTDTLALFGRERIADVGDVFDQFVPADLFAQIAVTLKSKIAERTAGGDWKHQRTDVGAASHKSAEENSFGDTAPERTHGLDPPLADGCAHSDQHWVSGSEIISAAFPDHKKCERNEVHPRQHPIATIAQEADESADPQWCREQIYADQKLVAQESFGTSLTHVAGVNMSEEVKGNESVPDLP